MDEVMWGGGGGGPEVQGVGGGGCWVKDEWGGFSV